MYPLGLWVCGSQVTASDLIFENIKNVVLAARNKTIIIINTINKFTVSSEFYELVSRDLSFRKMKRK